MGHIDDKILMLYMFIGVGTILGYMITQSMLMLFSGMIAIGIVAGMNYKAATEVAKTKSIDEGFETIDNIKSITSTNFKKGNKRNPFSNVLLPEISSNPDRDPAPPSFDVDTSVQITNDIKKTVQMLNPGINNTNKQLFGDIWEEFNLDQSNRAFYSTANTRIENDQGAFGKFLYGDMPSSKEDSIAGNLQREKDAFRYILY